MLLDSRLAQLVEHQANTTATLKDTPKIMGACRAGVSLRVRVRIARWLKYFDA